MPRPLMPPWLRRGLEAALVAAVVAIASLWGDRLSAGAPYPFPGGPAGALQVAPAVLAIGVLTTAYPVAMAATRGDAVMGALAAFLVACDLTIVFIGGHVSLERMAVVLPTGAFIALLALGPAAAGLVGSQVGASLGFGRRAGAIAAVASAVGAGAVLVTIGLVA